MKSLCAVYCLALWTYFAVFAFMAEAPELGRSQKGRIQFGTMRILNSLGFHNSLPFLEINRLDDSVSPIEQKHTDILQFDKNESAVTERMNISAKTSQDPLGRLDVFVDLSLASKNSCVQINDSVYMAQEPKITLLTHAFSKEHCPIECINIINLDNSSFKGAIWDAEDLSEFISSKNETNHSQENPNIISGSRTLHFLVNVTEVTMKSEPNQHYVIFKCDFIIKNSSAINTVTRDEHFGINERTKNVSVTIRLLGAHDLKEFNIRSIVEDMDKFVVPKYCSSKIPFFYFLVISGELRENSFLLIFITFNYVLSTCSLAFIFLTAKLSLEWRQRRSNIILINFAISIFSQIILHFISDFSEIDEALCAFVTVLCHYFTLVQFFWTSTIAYMQYRRYVQVFEEKNGSFLIKPILFTWISPILIISASLIYVFSMSENSKKTCDAKYKICSLINTYLLKYSVSLPLFVTLFVNFIFYILIFRNLLQRKSEFDQRASRTLVEMKLAFVLFFLLDLNLIVAIIADMFRIDILALIFVTSNSLQGFLLFVVFVIRNKCSRKMYVRWMKIMLDRITFYIS